MGRARVDAEQRRRPMPSTVREVVQRYVSAEAELKGVAFSQMVDTLLTEALIARGHSADILWPGNEADEQEGKKKTLLRLYQDVGNITEAAAVAGISLATVYRWSAKDKTFERELARVKMTRPGTGMGHISPSHQERKRLEMLGKRQSGRRPVRTVNPDGSIDESGL